MIDISIKSLQKAITSKKRAREFVERSLRAVEKIDGTKLTLIRNSEPFDPDDYSKNWIVAYKGCVIYPHEFHGLAGRDPEIREYSLGTSQYKFVHDHLRNVHTGTGAIPLNTEFFIEFVQNKPTVTRDYDTRHGLFLVGYGPTQYITSGGYVHSFATMEMGLDLIKKYSLLLQVSEFPVIFEGSIRSPESILEGCRDQRIKERFEGLIPHVDFADPESIVGLLVSVFSDFGSSLGGRAEGAVLTTGGSIFKVLAEDQHSRAVRAEKKSRYRAEGEEEEAYWSRVGAVSSALLNECGEDSIEGILSFLSSLVYQHVELPQHPIKTAINVQEDVFLTAKLRFLSRVHGAQRVAVIPMAAKPFHIGHDSLIRQALADGNERVIVFLSKNGRDGIGPEHVIPIWKEAYLPGIAAAYGKRVHIRFTDSPMIEAAQFVQSAIAWGSAHVDLYGGIDAQGDDEAQKRVDKIIAAKPELAGRVSAVAVPRSKTHGISGGEMRDLLRVGCPAAFKDNLPTWLNGRAKDFIWSILSPEGRKRAA